MSDPQYDSGPTSNDLLRNLVAKHAQVALDYQINAQSVDGEQRFDNVAAVSTEADSPQEALLTSTIVLDFADEFWVHNRRVTEP